MMFVKSPVARGGVQQECSKCMIVAQASVNEIVVPNMFPGFIIILLRGVVDVIQRDNRADALDILEAGF